jgi:hypothetical protein
LICAIGATSSARGMPAVTINNAAANHSVKPHFFLPG